MRYTEESPHERYSHIVTFGEMTHLKLWDSYESHFYKVSTVRYKDYILRYNHNCEILRSINCEI